MWKVGDVEPVRVMGAEGDPYGFNVTTEGGKVSLRSGPPCRVSVDDDNCPYGQR